MNCSHLLPRNRINVGFGLRFVAKRAKWLPTLLATAVKKVVGGCGIGFPHNIVIVIRLAIFGILIRLFSVRWPSNIALSVKIVVRRLMLSGGIILWGVFHLSKELPNQRQVGYAST